MQGVFHFPGIAYVKSARYTQTHGSAPDVITVECVPQPAGAIRDIGTAVFTFGDFGIQMPGCKVESANLRVTTRGHIQHIRIMDRRWKWAIGGEISGLYNLLDSDGEYVRHLKFSAQQLAGKLLEAMGEYSYDVSDMPSDVYPERKWIGAHPATELDRLCDDYGCRIVLGVGDDPVRAVRLGTGAGAPASVHAVSINHGLNGDNRPDSIAVYGDQIIYQGLLELEAIGEDLDGSFKLINDLTYKPASGWSTSFKDILLADETPDLTADERIVAEQLAYRSVFRWFRIKGLYGVWSGDGDRIPYFSGRVKTADQFDPQPYRLEYANDGLDHQNKRPPTVYGIHTRHSEHNVRVGTNEGESSYSTSLPIVPYHSRVGEDGIVRFSQHVYRLKSASDADQQDDIAVTAPELYLLTAFYIRDYDSYIQSRWRWERTIRTPMVGTGAYVVKDPSLQLQVNFDYAVDNLDKKNPQINSATEDPIYLGTQTTNESTVIRESESIIDQTLPNFQRAEMGKVVYRGLQPIRVTGQLHEVTWFVSDEKGAFTYVSHNSQTDPYVQSYRRKVRDSRADVGSRSHGQITTKLTNVRRSNRREPTR